MSLQFWLTTLVVVASPGTGVVYTLAAGLSRGARASLVAAFGCTLGILPHIAAALLGLAAMLHASALAFAAVKYAGVAYLLVMAWLALSEGGALSDRDVADRRSDLRVVVDAIPSTCSIPSCRSSSSPSCRSSSTADEAHPLVRMGELSAAFMTATFVVFALYGVFAAAARDHVLARPSVLAWMRRGFAVAFGALAARLAFAER